MSEPAGDLHTAGAERTQPWWRDAVFYEVYLRSFADGNADGVGDLFGLRARLPYLSELGVDALWVTPFYRSPMVDHGYDVADPRDVDPLFGDLAAFDAMLADAHDLGLRVTIDLVPNHTSTAHPWFVEALASPPGSAARDRYLFRDGRGSHGALPPNNWESNFGGPAWAQVPDGQWYLHFYAPEQPDLNWRNLDVVADYEQTLRFWLDRGVDGFRVDVAHGLFKDAELRDNPGRHEWGTGHGPETPYTWDQPEVHEIYRRWRAILDSYPGQRMAVGEVYLADPIARARYVRPDELNLVFNFALLWARWDAVELHRAITESLAATASVGAPTTWVLSSHDAVRHLTRYGGGERGRRRAAAALLVLLALPGPAYLYQGEELGLPEVELPDWAIQDPLFAQSGGRRRGRDGCRVPMPWSGSSPPYGFASAPTPTWLPVPAHWAPLTAAAQQDDPGSMLALYRTALRRRRVEPALRAPELSWLDSPPGTLMFSRAGAGSRPLVCAVNLSDRPVSAPAGELVLASIPGAGREGVLPADSAVWSAPADPIVVTDGAFARSVR